MELEKYSSIQFRYFGHVFCRPAQYDRRRTRRHQDGKEEGIGEAGIHSALPRANIDSGMAGWLLLKTFRGGTL